MGMTYTGSYDTRQMKRAIGPQPVITVLMGGVPVECLVDSGSQVSMVEQRFFDKHLRTPYARGASSWLEITAANGLSVPYEGLVETDICIGGITAQHSGVIIVRRAPTVVGGREVPGLLGTNVWRHFPEFQSIVNTQRGFAHVASRQAVLVPANSRCTVAISGPPMNAGDLVIEPLTTPLPGNLIVQTSVIQVPGHCAVTICNPSMKDVWLGPKTRVGCMTSGVIEDGNTQVDVHGDKLHVSLNEPPVRGDGPLEGLDLSGLDGHPLQSRVVQAIPHCICREQRRSREVGSRAAPHPVGWWACPSATIQASGMGPNGGVAATFTTAFGKGHHTPKLQFLLQPNSACPQEVG